MLTSTTEFDHVEAALNYRSNIEKFVILDATLPIPTPILKFIKMIKKQFRFLGTFLNKSFFYNGK